MPNETELINARNSIFAYMESDIVTRVHNSQSSSWEILPYTIGNNFWYSYLAILNSFIMNIQQSPQERIPRPLYIHATVYLPFNTILHSVTRYQIYLMFLKITPTSIFRCMRLFRFRFFFIATNTLLDSIEFASLRYSDEWSEPFYYDVVIEQ